MSTISYLPIFTAQYVSYVCILINKKDAVGSYNLIKLNLRRLRVTITGPDEK